MFRFALNRVVAGAVLIGVVGAGFSSVALADRFDGEIEVVFVDRVDGGGELEHFLREPGGRVPKRLEWPNGKVPPGLRSGDKVKVQGRARGRRIEVESIDLALDGGASATGDSTVAAQTGTRRVLALLVDMQDARSSSRYTVAQVADNLFDGTRSADEVLRVSSFQQLGLERDTDGDSRADVFGPFDIPYSAANSCDYYGWAAAADDAASRAGINVSAYQHRVYVLPHYSELPACAWAGLGNLGCGDNCRVWIAEGQSGMVYAHELGHNLGWHHSGTDPENDGSLNSEYGDKSGIMGSNRAWHQANAPHRDQLGWLGAYSSSLVTTSTGGVFDLYALEADPAAGTVGHQVIKLPKPDTGEHYYLSYRRVLGEYGTESAYADKISVHRHLAGSQRRTALVATLALGDTFQDAANGLVVRPLALGGEAATVEVAYECAAAKPSVSVSPASWSTAPGGSGQFQVSVSNNDAASCGSTSFALSATDAAGVSSSLSAASVTVAPGDVAQVTWRVSVDTAAGDGTRNLSVAAAGGDSLHQASAGLSVSVDASSPSAPSGLSASVSNKGEVDLAWNAASDSGSGVAAYRVYRDGALIARTNVTAFTDRNTTDGATYTYGVAAEDGAGNISAMTTTTVTVSSSNGKGNGKPSKDSGGDSGSTDTSSPGNNGKALGKKK